MPESQEYKYNVPVSNYPTPSWGDPAVDGISVVDEVLIEYVEPNAPNYVKLSEGATHPNVKDFPNHRLLKEEQVQYGTNRRIWCNGFRNEDQYNYSISFSGESNSHPIFTRRYLVRRDTYVPYATVTKESQFTGIYLVRVTNAGAGYDPKSPPTISFSGGGGSGASARAIVGSSGTLDWIYLTSEGSGYTSQPSVSISGGGGAAATAFLNLPISIVGSITIDTPGSSYETAPGISIVGGGGSGATATTQVNSDGEVVAVRVTSYGYGYSSVPDVTPSGGGGSGATFTANLEEVQLKLVKEDAQALPDEDPRRSLYLLVTRVYEALSGPVLVDHDYEPFIDTYISSLKQIVAGSTVPSDMFYENRTAGSIIEYHPLSFHRYIKVTSKINVGIAWENGADDQEYFGTVNYSFPNEIHEDPSIHVYWAFKTTENGTTLAIDFGWKLNVIEGYSGPVRAKFRTRYTFDPEDAAFQAALPEVTYIRPEAHVINDGFAYSGANLIAQATQFAIPSTLHPELEIDVTGTGGPVTDLPGPISVIPATVPSGLTAGQEIIVSVKPEQWRFSLWKYTIISVFVPTPP